MEISTIYVPLKCTWKGILTKETETVRMFYIRDGVMVGSRSFHGEHIWICADNFKYYMKPQEIFRITGLAREAEKNILKLSGWNYHITEEKTNGTEQGADRN